MFLWGSFLKTHSNFFNLKPPESDHMNVSPEKIGRRNSTKKPQFDFRTAVFKERNPSLVRNSWECDLFGG